MQDILSSPAVMPPTHTEPALHHAPCSGSLPCTQSPHSCPVTCSSSQALSCRGAAPVLFPLTACREQRSLPVPFSNCLPHADAQSQPSHPAPCGDSCRGTRTEAVLPPLFLQPFSRTHTCTTMVVSHDPRTPTRSPRSQPVPYGTSHAANTPTPVSALPASCQHTCTHAHTHSQCFGSPWQFLPLGGRAHSLLCRVINPHTHPARMSTQSPIATPLPTLPLRLAPPEPALPPLSLQGLLPVHTHIHSLRRACLAVAFPMAGPYGQSHRAHAPSPLPAGIVSEPFHCRMSGLMG